MFRKTKKHSFNWRCNVNLMNIGTIWNGYEWMYCFTRLYGGRCAVTLCNRFSVNFWKIIKNVCVCVASTDKTQQNNWVHFTYKTNTLN